MSPQLFAHPFSSYCQKVLMALYENHTRFEMRMLGPDAAATAEEFARLWPIKRFPVLLHEGRTIAESSIIIEYLDLHVPGPVRFIPPDADAALECRFMDRFFDNYIMTPMQRIVFDALRPADARDPAAVEGARAQLEVAYAWLDARMKDREWAAGPVLSLADCAAAPSLFYADWTHRIDPRFSQVHAYRRRLLARPSFARAVDEARPYRSYFPLGAPDRD